MQKREGMEARVRCKCSCKSSLGKSKQNPFIQLFVETHSSQMSRARISRTLMRRRNSE